MRAPIRPSLAALLVLATISSACGPGERDGARQETAALPAAAAIHFTDRAAEWGLSFEHFNGRDGHRYLVEVLGAGVALFDYDGDGDLDVFLVQGARLGPELNLEAATAPLAGQPLTDRLFRNDLTPEAGGGLVPRFVDVTFEAGLGGSRGYGLGVATGDIDNDGFVDLFITRFGNHQLWRNRGDGSFEDVTLQAGVADDRFAASASFFDADRDGCLDLFVGNYLDYSYQNHRTCYGPGGAVDYCGPASYRPVPDRLLKNRGNGRFDDVTAASGIATAYGPALGVVAADLDADGWQDVLVANDGAANQLWLHQPDGTYRDDALIAGCAVNAAGATEAGMGVDAADYDGDSDLDLFITHLGGETNTLYQNLGKGSFTDQTRATDLGPPSFPYTGFGTRFVDLDLDGWLDLPVANGAIKDLAALVERGDAFPLHEPNQLYRNLGNGRFAEIAASAGEAFTFSEVSRGLATGDLDLDGDLDLVITNNGGPVRLLVNETRAAGAWLALDVVTGDGQRTLLGALARLERRGAPSLLRRQATDGSYLSASEPRLVFGLGGVKEVGGLEVAAPPAPPLRIRGLAAGRTYRVAR